MLGLLLGFACATALLRPPPPGAQPLSEQVPPLKNSGFVANEVQEMPGEDAGSELIFQGYLGTYENRIAIYRGEAPQGTLQHITDYEVRDDLREQLEAGVPFRDAGELITLLENYTS